jgi:sugar phosphate isomerase/epimerase
MEKGMSHPGTPQHSRIRANCQRRNRAPKSTLAPETAEVYDFAMKLPFGCLFAVLVGTPAALAERPLHAMDTCTKVRYPGSTVHSPEQQLDWLRKYGYAGIAWTEEEPAAVARVAEAAAQRGVPMSAIYLSATLTRAGLRTDPRFPAIVEALKGRDTLLWLHIGSPDFACSAVEGDAVAVPELRRLADFAAERGLRIAIYPHVKDWTERTADAIRLAKAVARENFGINFNLCHALMAGDEGRIGALLSEAAPRLFSVTVNGADSGAGGTTWQRLIQPLGQGSYKVGDLLGELDRIGYQGPVFQQGYGIGQPPEALLAASMHAWRTRIDAGWQPLDFADTWPAWQGGRGGWLLAGGAELAADPLCLSPLAGTGVAVNGRDGREPDLQSVTACGDCDLHVEFLLAGKSNSGVYLMGRYEVQIYDSHGVVREAYPGLECGGIYPRWIDNANHGGHSPRVNAALPPGVWQSFDIRFRAPRFDAGGRKTADAEFVRVAHNGQLVHENIRLGGPTRAGLEPEVAVAPLRLQGDHGPVAFRNLRIRPAKAPPAVP